MMALVSFTSPVAHAYPRWRSSHVFKGDEMLFRVASKSETSLIFMKSICKIIVPHQELNIMVETSFFSICSALRASFLGCCGSRAGKGRIACNYVFRIWISALKELMWNAEWQRCSSNGIIILHFMLIGRNLTAQSVGSKLSFLFTPSNRVLWRACSLATSEANECLSQEPMRKCQIPACKWVFTSLA